MVESLVHSIPGSASQRRPTNLLSYLFSPVAVPTSLRWAVSESLQRFSFRLELISKLATYRFHPEVVALGFTNGFSSGGGFSNYFKQPSYQAEAVASYLDKIGDKFSGDYNVSGRAYPDIAAQGVNYTIVWDGQVLNIDGTSASTPTAASIFTLLNDALISRGRPPMGFLNPWLYKKGYKAFFDVTSGSAIGCNTTGFEATEGWDAVSGFGTPVSRFIINYSCQAVH